MTLLTEPSDSWYEDALRSSLQSGQALGLPKSFQIRDIRIQHDQILINFNVSNNTIQSILIDFGLIVSFIYGFFDNRGESKERITVLAWDDDNPLFSLNSPWRAAKAASESRPWIWLAESRIDAMATDELIFRAKTALYTLENFIRGFLSKAFEESYGYSWESKALPNNLKRRAERRSSQRLPSDVRPGKGGILRHLNFPDLRAVINLNWTVLSSKIWDQDEFNREFASLEPIRIAIAHNHPLTQAEVEQMERISVFIIQKLSS